MIGNITQLLHSPVSNNGSSIDWERSHHTNQVSLEESSHSMGFVTVPETLHHRLVFWISEIVSLHQGLYVVKRIVKCPVHGSSDTSCDEWYVNGYVWLLYACGSQSVCYLFDCCEIQCKSGCLSDGSGCLTSVQSLESVLLEDFNNSIQWSWVHFVNRWSLNLNSYTSVFDGTLCIEYKIPQGMSSENQPKRHTDSSEQYWVVLHFPIHCSWPLLSWSFHRVRTWQIPEYRHR